MFGITIVEVNSTITFLCQSIDQLNYRLLHERIGLIDGLRCISLKFNSCEQYVKLIPGFRIRIRTDPHVFALPGSGQKGKEMNE